MKVLHVWGDRGWVPYNQHSLGEPEYLMRLGHESRGLSTMHKLLKLGYVMDVEANRHNLPTVLSDVGEPAQTFITGVDHD